MKLILTFLIIFSSALFAYDNKDLNAIKYYYSKEYISQRYQEKSIHHAKNFLKYILVLEEKNYQSFLKEEKDLIKRVGISSILDRQDFEALLIKFGTYHQPLEPR